MGKLGWFMSRHKLQQPHHVRVSPWGHRDGEGSTKTERQRVSDKGGKTIRGRELETRMTTE